MSTIKVSLKEQPRNTSIDLDITDGVTLDDNSNVVLWVLYQPKRHKRIPSPSTDFTKVEKLWKDIKNTANILKPTKIGIYTVILLVRPQGGDPVFYTGSRFHVK